MPELPEVETTIRYLRPIILDQVIQDFAVSNKGQSTFNLPANTVKEKLLGAQAKSLERHGKWILWDFDSFKAVSHLRMSGRFKVADEVIDHPHNRFQIYLESGKVINYLDQRRFGTFHFTDSFESYPSLQQLGPDAFEVTPAYLFAKLQKLKKPIYSALLDQTVIAGLGNIYVNEVLHASQIHPQQPANTLSQEQIELIVNNTSQILQQALALRGTTLIDNLYQDPEGKTGDFSKMLKVYGKKKDPDIEVLKIGGRSVFVHRKTLLRK